MSWFGWNKSSEEDSLSYDDEYNSNDDDVTADNESRASTPSIATSSVENMQTVQEIKVSKTPEQSSSNLPVQSTIEVLSKGNTFKDDDDSSLECLNDMEFQGLIHGTAIPSILDATMQSSRNRLESELSTDLLSLGDDEVNRSENDQNDNSNKRNQNVIKNNALKQKSHNTHDLNIMDEDRDQHGKDENDDGTSFEEKQSVLTLAAEQDRVDIIQAILGANPVNPHGMAGAADTKSSFETSKGTMEDTINLEVFEPTTDERSEREKLLNPIDTCIPPLHIAISYGSVGAVSCLLRMGADPSLRPNANKIHEYYQIVNRQRQTGNDEMMIPITPVKNISRFDGMSAWELVFSESNGNSSDNQSTWSFSTQSKKKSSMKTINLTSTKKDGIRHSFTAEALRCIGSDELERLQQLLNAGMPPSIEIGNKPLDRWAIDMNAIRCQQVLCPDENKDSEMTTTDIPDGNLEESQRQSIVLDRANTDSEGLTYQQLRNRYNELESLSMALSSCLENLAEEVAVCSGLLLVGKGASALASHVRTLKSIKDRKYDDLCRLENVYENTLDELTYWIEEKCSVFISESDIQEQLQNLSTDATAAYLMSVAKDPDTTFGKNVYSQEDGAIQASESFTHDDQDELESQQRHQLTAKIMMCENKIRQLRASIADLSDENVRNLDEVERRGLSGGIILVRNIRDEIREIEYHYSELQNEEAICRAKIAMAQHFYFTKKNMNHKTDDDGKVVASTSAASIEVPSNEFSEEKNVSQQDAILLPQTSAVAISYTSESMELIQSKSSSIVNFPQNDQSHRRLFALWQIILRIIGLRTSAGAPMSRPVNGSWTSFHGNRSPEKTRPVMIV